MEKIEIAKIVKAQGVKGDVKVVVFADDDFDFASLKNVFVGATPAKIEKAYKLSGGYGVKFDIIDSRNIAETFKNQIVYANKADIVHKADSYFIADLIGKQVETTDGEYVGKIVDVQNFGSADVFYISNEDKQVLASHIKGLIVAIEAEKVVLDAEKFRQVAVYED